MTYIAGPFTITGKVGGGSAATIGGTEQGLTLLESPQVQDINNDEFGAVPVDGVDLGMISGVRFDFIDYGAIKPLLYAGRAQGDPKASVGKLLTATAIEIVATPVAGTTAAALEGAYTFYCCRVIGDFEVLLGSRHRKGPVTFRCFPTPSGSNVGKCYAVAAAAGS